GKPHGNSSRVGAGVERMWGGANRHPRPYRYIWHAPKSPMSLRDREGDGKGSPSVSGVPKGFSKAREISRGKPTLGGCQGRMRGVRLSQTTVFPSCKS